MDSKQMLPRHVKVNLRVMGMKELHYIPQIFLTLNIDPVCNLSHGECCIPT